MGKSSLKIHQTPIKVVVFAVGDLWVSLHVIEMVVPLDRPPEIQGLGLGLSSAEGLGIEVQLFLGQPRLRETSGLRD